MARISSGIIWWARLRACNVFSLAAIDIGTSAPVFQTDILDLESLYRTADDYLDLFSANTSRHYSGYSTPSSGYSFDPYNELESAFTDQSSSRSAPSSEYDFSDFSSAGSALDVHNDLSLQWDPDLALLFADAADPTSGFNSFDNSFHIPRSDVLSLPDPSHQSSGADSTDFESHLPQNPVAPVAMTLDEMDLASVMWDWQPSSMVWLDADVSSEVYIPNEPFAVTTSCKVSRIERVHGLPSEYPIPRVSTAYIVDLRAVRQSYKDKDGNDMKLDSILNDQVSPLWFDNS